MPIYEYACSKCDKVTDVLQKVDDLPPTQCESCGAKGSLQRVVSRTSFVLKGGGWYADLYGSSKKSGAGTETKDKAKPDATEGAGSKAAPTTSSSASGTAASTTTSSGSTSAPATPSPKPSGKS